MMIESECAAAASNAPQCRHCARACAYRRPPRARSFYSTQAGRDHFKDQLQSIRYCVQEVGFRPRFCAAPAPALTPRFSARRLATSTCSTATSRAPTTTSAVSTAFSNRVALTSRAHSSLAIFHRRHPEGAPPEAQRAPGDGPRPLPVRDRAEGRVRFCAFCVLCAHFCILHRSRVCPAAARSLGLDKCIETAKARMARYQVRAVRHAPHCLRFASHASSPLCRKGYPQHAHRAARAAAVHRDVVGGEVRVQRGGPGGPGQVRGGRGGLRVARLPRLRRGDVDAV